MPTWDNPHPLANPFNQRVHGNFHVGAACAGKYLSRTHDGNLAVPNQDIPYNGSPEWYEMRDRSRLTVPNQDIPAGDQTGGPGHAGFINDRLFRLPDGTVMDYRTGRVFARSGASAPRVIGPADIGLDGGTRWDGGGPSLEELVNNTDRYVNTALPDGGFIERMDPKSAAYWLKAEEEAEKLKNGMSDAQKALIAAFEAHFPKSRLIEESRKAV